MLPVVYRPFPTSNHNGAAYGVWVRGVVYRPFPTSNHNLSSLGYPYNGLYIVRFLHQTTTIPHFLSMVVGCISSVSYIKPQLLLLLFISLLRCISSVSYIKPQRLYNLMVFASGCISSVSYIKPQPLMLLAQLLKVVYRPFPTSNHNDSHDEMLFILLYIVRFLHQTTTNEVKLCTIKSCISSVPYIKPQHPKGL